jgi:hypothetical protein
MRSNWQPAFPTAPNPDSYHGLSKREFAAIHIMAAMISNNDVLDVAGQAVEAGSAPDLAVAVAKQTIAFVDRLFAELRS